MYHLKKSKWERELYNILTPSWAAMVCLTSSNGILPGNPDPHSPALIQEYHG